MRLAAISALLLIPVLLAAQDEDRGIVTVDDEQYQLRPGDVLRIDVWQQETLSGQYQINELGRLNYPPVGQIQAATMSVAELRDTVRVGLESLFETPFVTVTPLFRLSVLGRVRAPGLYTADPTLTVLDLVAMAGGPDEEGNLNSIRLLRSGAEREVAFERDNLRGLTLQEIGIRSGDQIYVPKRFLTRTDLLTILSATQVILSIIILVRQ